MSKIKHFNHLNNKFDNLLNEKTKKLFLTLSLTGIMMIFYLCDLNKLPIYGLCERYSLLQIPVIIGACVGGPTVGLILSIMYGIIDMTYASFSIELTDVLTSPFATSVIDNYSIHGNFVSLIMCFLPKIFLALVAGLVFKYLKNYCNSLGELVLSALCTFLAILCSFSTYMGLFNFVFVNYLLYLPDVEKFSTIVNAGFSAAFIQKLVINLIIDPIAIFALKNVAHFD